MVNPCHLAVQPDVFPDAHAARPGGACPDVRHDWPVVARHRRSAASKPQATDGWWRPCLFPAVAHHHGLTWLACEQVSSSQVSPRKVGQADLPARPDGLTRTSGNAQPCRKFRAKVATLTDCGRRSHAPRVRTEASNPAQFFRCESEFEHHSARGGVTPRALIARVRHLVRQCLSNPRRTAALPDHRTRRTADRPRHYARRDADAAAAWATGDDGCVLRRSDRTGAALTGRPIAPLGKGLDRAWRV